MVKTPLLGEIVAEQEFTKMRLMFMNVFVWVGLLAIGNPVQGIIGACDDWDKQECIAQSKICVFTLFGWPVCCGLQGKDDNRRLDIEEGFPSTPSSVEDILQQRRLQDDECTRVCPSGDDVCDDPHMQGLRGQRIDWSGVDGGWYSLIKDDNAYLNVNVRVTAPLPDEFPDRQLMTSLAILSEGHSVVIEVDNPYTIETDGCRGGISPCLANGGLRTYVDGQEAGGLLRFSRHVPVGDGAITVSGSNLPVECRQFGGDKIWARLYQDMVDGRRQLRNDESLEEWILRYDHSMAAPGWCAKYIAENDLADLQSNHAIFKIETPTVTIRLNAGVNYQGDGEVDWDGRVLPDLEFWQMDVGMDGLDGDNPALSGLLGETARPVYDENGRAIMDGFDAFRGTVEDYRVSGALGVHFPLLDEKEEGHE